MKQSGLNSSDLSTLKNITGPLLLTLDPNGTAYTRAFANPIREFPPLDVPSGFNWIKDNTTFYPGLLGWWPNIRTDIVNLTSYLPGRYIAWANNFLYLSNNTAYSGDEWPPSGAFDKRPASSSKGQGYHVHYDLMSSTTTLKVLTLRIPRPILLRSYLLESRTDCCYSQTPSSFSISGSNDGFEWTLLDRRSGVTGWTSGSNFSFTANVTGMYSMFKLSSMNLASLGELRFFGQLEVDIPALFTMYGNTTISTPDIAWMREVEGVKGYFECAELCARDSSCKAFSFWTSCLLYNLDSANLPRSTLVGSTVGIRK